MFLVFSSFVLLYSINKRDQIDELYAARATEAARSAELLEDLAEASATLAVSEWNANCLIPSEQDKASPLRIRLRDSLSATYTKAAKKAREEANAATNRDTDQLRRLAVERAVLQNDIDTLEGIDALLAKREHVALEQANVQLDSLLTQTAP